MGLLLKQCQSSSQAYLYIVVHKLSKKADWKFKLYMAAGMTQRDSIRRVIMLKAAGFAMTLGHCYL